MCVVVVKKLYMVFVLYRWFDSGQDDGLIERELDVVHYVNTPPPPPQEPMEEDEQGYFFVTCSFLALLIVMCSPLVRMHSAPCF